MRVGRLEVPRRPKRPAGSDQSGVEDARRFCARLLPLWFAGVTALALILSSGDQLFAQATNQSISTNRQRDLGEATRYWRELHEKQNREKVLRTQQQQQNRAEVQKTISALIEAGESVVPEELAAEMPRPIERQPSIFQGRGDFVRLAIALLLIGVLITSTLIRHKRSAEIRALTGKYIVDGTEAVNLKMPALFTFPTTPLDNGTGFADSSESPDDDKLETKPAYPPPVAEFFEQAPERLEEMRKLLSAFGKAFDDDERHQVLVKLYELTGLLKSKADFWDLRPAWQMSSALEMLIKRLVEKGQEATPSTLRTVAGAMDVLNDLCAPGVRPDLIINPPISVLAVDDDPLCLRAVVFALQKAEMKPDVASNGEKAVALANEKPYDVVFMDIQMPGIDGLEACRLIRKMKRNAGTPVVFVTVRSDFNTRAQSTLKGGSDLMAKPFLMFEITVKALMFTMRKRLQLAASCERQLSNLVPPTVAKDSKPQASAKMPNSPGMANGIEGAQAKAEPVKIADCPVQTEVGSAASVDGTADSQKSIAARKEKQKRKSDAAATATRRETIPAKS